MFEGLTERAFLPHLRRFLKARVIGPMPKLDPQTYNGRLPTQGTLKRHVENLLSDSQKPADAVIALTDVYTGTREFKDAADAKTKMGQWVDGNPRFHPHVALHDFEAWLLPFWKDICELAGSNRTVPSQHPESVNHAKPPSYWIHEAFRTGTRGHTYSKVLIAGRILLNQDLILRLQRTLVPS